MEINSNLAAIAACCIDSRAPCRAAYCAARLHVAAYYAPRITLAVRNT